MPLFYAGEKKLFQKYGTEGVVVMTPMAGTSAIQLATGQVEMGVVPYTNAIAAYTRSPTFSVVGGSGIQGLIVVAQPGIESFESLKGKKIGTFQADTLDILVYDYLKAKGMTYADVNMQYLGDSVELTNAFIAGHLDAISSIEPDMASLLAAAQAQPPGVDIRDMRDFMYGRAESMKALSYINKDPDEGFVNFSLLEEVIKESPELWQKVKVHSMGSH
jgi:ABC-type nitrate/sulfonate/bicarbonate transport system substrate-binding protein